MRLLKPQRSISSGVIYYALIIWLFGLSLFLVACQNEGDSEPLPTLIPIHTWTSSPSPSATVTPTALPTLTATPTLSPSPTDSPTPSPTFTQTFAPTPIQGVISSEVGGYLRRGPGVDYEIVGELLAGETFSVAAYMVSGADIWYLVQLSNGTTAWISDVVADLVGGVPMEEIALAITAPPTTTLTPSPSPTITPTLPQGGNARVTGEKGVNVREGAGYGYDILTTLDQGEPLVLIGRNEANTWYQAVTFQNPALTGWVNRDFISPVVDTRLLLVTWVGPARLAGVACGMNIHPKDGMGWSPLPPDLSKTRWVRFPFMSSARHFPSLEAAFAYFDPIIAAYNNAGLEIILVLTHETYGELAGWDWVVMGSADWTKFIPSYVGVVSRIAQHYRGQVAAYEIWNEGDAQKGNEAAVAISATDYAPMLRDSAAAIRRADSQARVLIGGLLDPNGTYLRRVKSALGGVLPIDAIAIHPYGRGAPNDTTVFSQYGNIDEVIDAYAAVAPDIPIWITEIGAVGDNSQGRWGEAALYMQNLFDHLRTAYYDVVEVVLWYAWSDAMHPSQRVNGIVSAGNQPKSPIYDTFFNLCGG